MDIPARLSALYITLPAPPRPIASYVPAVEAGGILYVSGQLPLRDGELMAEGKVPSPVKIAEATAAARQCVINALAVVADHLGGDWSRFERIVRVGVFVQSAEQFGKQSEVANGASDLLMDIFGEAGKHARAAVGVNALPLNAAVEVELSVGLR